jgi:hypothetical protein
VVSLKDVVEAMDLPNSEWTSYLNPKTGEIVMVTDQDPQFVEDEDLNEGDLPEWQRERLANVRAALESGDLLVLPNRFEIHEWAIMERFSNGQARAARRDELLDAIQRCRGVPKFSERDPTARHRRRLVSLSANSV